MSKVRHQYDALVAAGELKPDADQAAAADRLDALAAQLEAQPRRGSTLWRMLGKKPESPRGLYLWGDVGRGKSMLMDLFFSLLDIRRKRRVHFAEFMLEVHARIGLERKKEAGDPIAPVAAAIADETRLLALRRDDGHQFARRDDPVAAVHRADRGGGDIGRDQQPRAVRTLQERPQPRAFPALHRADRTAPRRGLARMARRITAATGWGSKRRGWCPTARPQPRN